MHAGSHALRSSMLFLMLATFQGWAVNATVLVAGLIGSLLPDLDTPRSNQGFLFPIARLLSKVGLRSEHQGLSHSFLGLSLTCGISAIPLFYWEWYLPWIAFSLACFQHICEDAMGKQGVLWLWPLRTRYHLFPHPAFRLATPVKQWVYFAVTFPITLSLLWVNWHGAARLLDEAYADVTAVVARLNASPRKALTVRVRGQDLVRNEPIDEHFQVLGHLPGTGSNPWSQMVILKRRNGDLVAAADGFVDAAQVKVNDIRVVKEREIAVITHEIDLSGKLLGSLNRVVRSDHSHRLFGEVQLRDSIGKADASPLRFSPVRMSGKRLLLEFATVQDVERQVEIPVVVVKGNVVVRYAVEPGTKLPFRELKSTQRVVKVESKQFPIKLDVRLGGNVEKGDCLATIPLKAREVDLFVKQLEHAGKLEGLIRAERSRFIRGRRQEAASLEKQLRIARESHENHVHAYRAGGVPRNKVVAENLKVIQAEDRLHRQLADTQDRLAGYDRQLGDLLLKREDLQRKIKRASHAAFFTAPVSGMVTDVRVLQEGATYLSYVTLQLEKSQP